MRVLRLDFSDTRDTHFGLMMRTLLLKITHGCVFQHNLHINIDISWERWRFFSPQKKESQWVVSAIAHQVGRSKGSINFFL